MKVHLFVVYYKFVIYNFGNVPETIYHCICETLNFIAMKKLIKKPIGYREIIRDYFSIIGLTPTVKSKR